MSLQGSMAVIRHSGVESTELEGEHSSFLLVPGFWEAVSYGLGDFIAPLLNGSLDFGPTLVGVGLRFQSL